MSSTCDTQSGPLFAGKGPRCSVAINDGACGDLVINVTEASFVLDCQLRYTATDDHSTRL